MDEKKEELKNEEVNNEVNEAFDDDLFEDDEIEMSTGECIKQIGRNVKKKVTDKETWKRIGKRVVKTAVGVGVAVGTIAVAGAIANKNSVPELPDNGDGDADDFDGVDMEVEISEDGQTMTCRIVGDDADESTDNIEETEK